MNQKTRQPDLSGQVALVTGASRGIGRALAISLAKAGAHILALAKTPGALEALDDDIRALGGTASLIPMDLTDNEGIEKLAATLADRYGKLDILVAAAAMLGELAPIPDIAPEIWEKTLNLNLTANWRLLRALDPLLRNSASAHVIVFTSRVGGERARAYWGAYGVSKAGLEILAKTYAEETKSTPIKVSIIDPGAMRTSMRAQAMPGEDPQTLPSPETLEPLFYEALSTDHDGAKRFVFRQWREENDA